MSNETKHTATVADSDTVTMKEAIIYAPLAHMVEGMDLECQPDGNTINEMLWCDLADMKGEDAAEAYMMRVEDSLDFEFDYHDYHAEWNRGYMADNGWY